MRNKKLVLPVLCGALLGVACATSGGKASVDESHLARLSQESLKQVDDARLSYFQARDEVGRAHNSVSDANSGVKVSKEEMKAIEQQEKAAQTRLDASQERNDSAQAQKAQQDVDDFQKKQQVAEAKIDAASSRQELARQQLELAQREQDLTEAELERAKYQALKDASSPDVEKYESSKFDDAVQKNRNKVAEAQRDVQAQQAAYQQKRIAWIEVQRRHSASSRPPPG